MLINFYFKALVYVFGFTLPSPGLPATTATLIYFALCNQMAWVLN
jgi:hypothetical protein